MKKTYPIVIQDTGEKYLLVTVPDFNDAMTQGADVTEAIEMAEDLIGLMGNDAMDRGDALPKPSRPADVQAKYPSDIVTLVNVDFLEYRRIHDSLAVKKNCTIPSWLNVAAEKAGVNFSAVLQEGLKRELHISENARNAPETHP